MNYIEFRRERNFGDILNATFRFAATNYKTLGMVVLYFATPFALISGIALGLYQSNLLNLKDQVGNNPFGNLFNIEYGVSILSSWLTSVFLGLIVASYMAEYQESMDKVTPTAVWERVRPKIGSTLLMGLLYGLAVIVFLIFCIVPVVYPLTMFALASTALVYEDLGATQSMSRSRQLLSSDFSDAALTFALLLVMWVVISILGSIFSVPMLILTFMKTVTGITDGTAETSTWPMILSAVFATLGSTLVQSLSHVAMSLQYFSVVEKREGLGLQERISSIGQNSGRNLLDKEGL